MRFAVMAPIAKKLGDQYRPSEYAMRSWPKIQGVERFVFAAPHDLDPGSQGLIDSLGSRADTVYLREKEYPEVESYWRKLYCLADARNILLDYAVRENYDYLVFLDTDVEVSTNGPMRLCRHGKDAVSGLVRVPTLTGTAWGVGQFGENFQWLVLKNTPKRRTLFPVEIACTSYLALSRKMMVDPKLRFEPYLMPGKKHLIGGEDHGYCVKAYKQGYRVYLDRQVKGKHWRFCWNQRKLQFELRPLRVSDK